MPTTFIMKMNYVMVLSLLFVSKSIQADGEEKNDTQPSCQQTFSHSDLKMSILESKMAALEAKMAAQEARLAVQDARATSCEKWRSGQEERDKKIQDDIQTLSMNITARSSNVSFLAVHTSVQHVPGNGMVKFSVVRHNSAPTSYGYDPVISHFRCPYDGMYFFFFTTKAEQCNAYMSFGIVKGATVLSTAKVYTNGASCQYSMSGAAVTPCRSGEYVFIKNLENGKRIIGHNADAIAGTHFTGYKI